MGRRKQQAPSVASAPATPRPAGGQAARRQRAAAATAAAAAAASNPSDEQDDDSMDVDVVYVRLKTSDGKYFNFTESEASCSNALRRMLESARNCCANNQQGGRDGASLKSGADHIPLQAIDSKVLANIQQWCKMHSYNQSGVSNGRADMTPPPPPPRADHERGQDSVNGIETDLRDRDEREAGGSRPQQQLANSWDMKFLASFAELDLLQLTSAANFLDITDLYNSCCKFIANKWEGMSVDAIRRTYNIRNDFAYDEDIQIIQENKRLGLSE